MTNLDWTTFTRRVNVNSSKEEIFNSWTTQANLEKWFLSSAEFKSTDEKIVDREIEIKKGDSFKWMWFGSENIEEGFILENNNKDLIRFTFLGCIVSVEVKVEFGENIIELIQYNIPNDEESSMDYFVGCTRGWTFFLTNLKSILEGGVDLRNKNMNLKNMINT